MIPSQPKSSKKPFKYRPDIDGLRAISVIMVLLFHAGIGFPGGYVGVDVFFVISGYLITVLIQKELANGTFSLKRFWERRIRRIFPAAYACVSVTLLLGFFVLTPPSLKELSESVVWQQLLVSNVYFWRTGNYFGGPAELKPLLHTWSLSVEEQFYMAYPVLLLLLHRTKKQWLIASLVTIAVASLSLSEWGARFHQAPAFFLLPTRAWEMLLGALLAQLPTPSIFLKRYSGILGLGGLLSIGFASIYFNSATRFPGLAALVPCLGAVLVIYSSSNDLSLVGRVLSKKPLVFVGLISYSLYLWHWPIFALLRYWFSPLSEPVSLLAIGLSFLLAFLSWKLIETPFRKGWPTLRGNRLFVAASAPALLLLSASAFVQHFQGFPQRFRPEVLEIASGVLSEGYHSPETKNIAKNGLPLLGIKEKPQDVTFLVWGDSHAKVVAKLCDQLASEHGLTGAIAYRGGVPPLLDAWTAGANPDSVHWNNAVLNYAIENQISDVLLVVRWSLYVDSSDGNKNLLVDERSPNASRADSINVMKRSMELTLSRFSRSGIRVTILKEIPLQESNPIQKLQFASIFNQPLPKGTTIEWNSKKHTNANRVIQSIDAPTTHILDPAPHCYEKSGHSVISDGTRSVYVDNNHLSTQGAELLLSPVLTQFFSKIK